IPIRQDGIGKIFVLMRILHPPEARFKSYGFGILPHTFSTDAFFFGEADFFVRFMPQRKPNIFKAKKNAKRELSNC
ncbi:MAG: hypothetical protein ACI30R_03285, partial [Sodaliphilus sp.]